MSTEFYIKDENGPYLSIDGKTKYAMLKGDAIYNFLKTEDIKGRCFHVEIDEDGNKIGIEATPEFIKQKESDKNHEAYLKRQKAKSGLNVISANIIVSNIETNVELNDTIEDTTMNVEEDVLQYIYLQNLRKALSQLKANEYDLIYYLFLAEVRLTERQYGAFRGLPQKTVNYRKHAIFRKIKKLL